MTIITDALVAKVAFEMEALEGSGRSWSNSARMVILVALPDIVEACALVADSYGQQSGAPDIAFEIRALKDSI